jgi:hypothetical protein
VRREPPLYFRVLAFCTILRSGVAVADEPPPEDGPEKRARFRADSLELDSKKDRLELEGNVVVTVDRYRLTSDKLSLERGPHGVVVEGGGQVAFCPCPHPPITLGFVSATVAPPTDLLLEQPTIRAFGVPVFWLPYLWLRSPKRVGLLPLELAYRGDDGLLLGSGIHVPLAGSDASDTSSLDVGGGAYVRGGAQVDARLVTAHTASAVKWDHLGRSALSADLRGALGDDAGAAGGSVAWTLDALRGARALGGPGLLEDVALRQDRARLTALYSDGSFTAGTEAIAGAARGGAFDGGYSWAPGATLSFGTGLGNVGALDVGTSVSSWRIPTTDVTPAVPPGASTPGTVTLASEHAEIRADWRAGPLAIGTEARSRGVATLEERERGYAVLSGVGIDARVPFVKEFGSADAPLQHWMTPFANGFAGATASSGPSVLPAVTRDGGFYAVSVGFRTTLGEVSGDRAAASLSGRALAVGEGREAPNAYAAWNASARAGFVALRSDGVATLANDAGTVSTSVLRLGPEGGFHVVGRATGLRGSVPLAARLSESNFDAALVPWLLTPGWSVGGGAVVPWTRFLATAADVDYDATSGTLLGVRGTVGYRHPCRCLAVAVWGSHRLQRSGVDTWLTLDLMP